MNETNDDAEIFTIHGTDQPAPPTPDKGLDSLFWILTLIALFCMPAAVIAVWRWAL